MPIHIEAMRPQKKIGIRVDDLRPGNDAVDGHGANHHRHHRVRWNTDGQQRDEGGLGTGIVGRFRPRHTLDGATAKAGRVTGHLLFNRIGRERAEHCAIARQDAE